MKTLFSNNRTPLLIRGVCLIGGLITTVALSIMLTMFVTPSTSYANFQEVTVVVGTLVPQAETDETDENNPDENGPGENANEGAADGCDEG